MDFQFVARVDDFHDFEMIVDAIQIEKRVAYVELGLGDDRKYWGLIHTGKRPKLGDIEAIVKAAGYIPMGDDDA